jgi:hypothetical protein
MADTDHIQDQILQSVQATLLAAATSAGASVFLESVDDIPEASHPAIAIEAGPETVDGQGMSVRGRSTKRTFDFYMRLTVAQNAGYRQACGRLLKEVEQALQASDEAATAGGLVRGGIHLLATDPDRDGNAAKVVYTIRSLWRAPYVCKENAPDTVS